jgi:hypothetical protein
MGVKTDEVVVVVVEKDLVLVGVEVVGLELHENPVDLEHQRNRGAVVDAKAHHHLEERHQCLRVHLCSLFRLSKAAAAVEAVLHRLVQSTVKRPVYRTIRTQT